MKALRVLISGKVHGVGFRYFARRKAKKLGLFGWVKNLEGGSVDAVFQGEDEKVDEMVKMLNAPLEKWRVFLHPSQANLVTKTHNGPLRVLGGAGTGKTVVAMHRAQYFAKIILSDDNE